MKKHSGEKNVSVLHNKNNNNKTNSSKQQGEYKYNNIINRVIIIINQFFIYLRAELNNHGPSSTASDQ